MAASQHGVSSFSDIDISCRMFCRGKLFSNPITGDARFASLEKRDPFFRLGNGCPPHDPNFPHVLDAIHGIHDSSTVWCICETF